LSEDVFEIDGELVRRSIADQVSAPASFEAAISCEDEMFLHALAGYRGDRERAFVTYLLQGRQMLDHLESVVAWAFGGWRGVGSFLDFACGYGRFTRHLVQELDPDRILVSDIYEDAVRFQRRRFGVRGVRSAKDPGELELERRFDMIFAASLFSHLPPLSFERWLAKLVSLLSERGVLVFSTHGIVHAGSSEGGSDCVFRPCSESRTLDVRDYGTVFASESFVGAAIREAAGSRVHWRRIANGLLGFQDVYLVSADADRDLTALDYDRGCVGHVAGCRTAGDRTLDVRGWAADLQAAETPVRVRIFADRRIVDEVSPDHDRPDVARVLGSPEVLRSGWSCRFSSRGIGPTDWISVKLRSQAGRERTLSLARLESMLRW
jgi:SAM-dependent methyltransferase